MCDLWKRLVEKLPQKEMELVAILFKNIWTRRNSFIFYNKFDNSKKIVQNALKQMEDYQSAQPYDSDQDQSIQRARQEIEPMKWKKN